jgi:response regulator RpfG family c-di-GMP phosphodiesterase
VEAFLVERDSATRLIALIVEVEQPEGLSARKLVLETAKHNVLTAYSGEVGLELMRRFPNVDVVVVHTEIRDISFGEFVKRVKEIRPDIRIIALAPGGDSDPHGAEFVLPSHEPHMLLELLASKFGASTYN